jgi:hypothetical protein
MLCQGVTVMPNAHIKEGVIVSFKVSRSTCTSCLQALRSNLGRRHHPLQSEGLLHIIDPGSGSGTIGKIAALYGIVQGPVALEDRSSGSGCLA